LKTPLSEILLRCILVEEDRIMRKVKGNDKRIPSNRVKREEEEKKFWEKDEREFFDEHDDEFIEGTYFGGLVKGTRRVESSEIRPDKGM